MVGQITLQTNRLYKRAVDIEKRLQRLEQTTNLITPRIKKIWTKALDTPVDIQAKWLHGELHARNVLVKNGAIDGIIDWGDITAGNIATDLAAEQSNTSLTAKSTTFPTAATGCSRSNRSW